LKNIENNPKNKDSSTYLKILKRIKLNNGASERSLKGSSKNILFKKDSRKDLGKQYRNPTKKSSKLQLSPCSIGVKKVTSPKLKPLRNSYQLVAKNYLTSSKTPETSTFESRLKTERENDQNSNVENYQLQSKECIFIKEHMINQYTERRNSKEKLEFTPGKLNFLKKTKII